MKITDFCILLFLFLGFSMENCFAEPLRVITIEQEEYHGILKSSAEHISFPLSKENKSLIEAMKSKLFDLGGVGLAAPQVNQSKRIIAIYIPESAALLRDNVTSYPMHIMINPSYRPVDESQKTTDFEGCYSVVSKMGKVPRYETNQLTYFDEEGERHETKESGFYARVLQHEIDHLNGILIVDRLTPDCIQGDIEEMMKLRRQELPSDKKELFDTLMKKKLNK